ncbi:ABC transporter permease [Arcticibacterium luteifluviistationis]|uniref:ABC transporter permease n=1 Tax=Arcticibacterium luteifluviistationis TaxID=1784714 RepID=A0A2Z4GFC8_9BACT|nr:ABC transporter permease [Arcticibacterium luteifluviistationis]AWV99493.1 hypothetical protein DJ013_15510 [Arcticibacterium luteifluviistationis]
MLRNYLKIAWRTLKRNKTYGIINVVGLTLSITSCILLFSFIAFHIDFDGFHENSNQVYRIVTEQQRETLSYQKGVPSPLGDVVRNEFDFEEQIARTVTFDELQINVNQDLKFIEDEGVALVEPSYFNIFNFPLLEGRFTDEFKEPSKAYITESIAKKYFGDVDAIGKTMKMDNSVNFTVIGILKDLPNNTSQKAEIYLSYATLKEYNDWYIKSDSWGGISSNMQCFIKLKSGVNPEQVEAAMAPFPERYRPNSSNVHTYKLQPLSDMHFNANYGGPMPKRTLWTLGIIGVFLMISACLNFINLATAQVGNRLKEVGVRKSLGSKKGQLFWQFMSETALIAFSATCLGFALAFMLLPSLNELFNSSISSSIFLDIRILAFVIGVFIFSTIVSGGYPGLLLSNFKPIAALKGKLAQVSVGGFNLRRSLIVVQFVISQVLIIGMLIIIKQMQFNQNVDLGFDKEAIINIPVASGMEMSDLKVFKERISAIPTVESSTVCLGAPSSDGNWGTSIRFKGKTEPEIFSMNVKAGDADYVKTFGLEILAGRNISVSDTANELLINETFAKKMNYTTAQEAIGKRLKVASVDNMEIVGVVKDFHDQSMHSDISAVGIGSFNDVYYNFAVKVNPNNMSQTLKDLEGVWASMNPDAVFTYQFVDEVLATFYETEQTILKLIQIFTLIALLIGAMGLYGLISFLVERKTKEIGVRKVLGSSNSAILWLFGKEFSVLLIVSFVIAAPISWWLGSKWLEDFTFQIPIKPSLFIIALAISALIACVSIGFKSFRAALMNPVESLRSE